MDIDRILYALSKQVPEIACEAHFETAYGGLTLYGADARKVAALVERLLRARLKQTERAAGTGR